MGQLKLYFPDDKSGSLPLAEEVVNFTYEIFVR